MAYFELYEKYKRSLYFLFDKNKSGLSGFKFYNGTIVNDIKVLYYNVDKIDPYLEEYDYLPVSSGPPLVSQKFKDVFSDLGTTELQFIPAQITDKKGNSNSSFWAINILNLFECLDKEKSIYDISEYGSYEIKKMFLKNNCLNSCKIIRLKENQLKIIVDDNFRSLVKMHKLNGMGFLEEGYSIYTNL
jgi:hypothetical protein